MRLVKGRPKCPLWVKSRHLQRISPEERQDVATLQLTAEDHLAIGVNAVHLKTRLGDVETDCLNCLHVWLLSIVGALTAPTFMALTCRWRSRPQHQKRTFRGLVGMSAKGQKRTFCDAEAMSALPNGHQSEGLDHFVGERNYAGGTAMLSAFMFKTSSNLFTCLFRRILSSGL